MTIEKISLLGAFLAVALALGACSDSSRTLSAKTFIRVGGKEITLKEYRLALKRLVPEGISELSPEEQKAIKRDMVNQLIEEALIVQEAERLGVEVSDSEVSAEVRGTKSGYDEKAFAETIEKLYGGMEAWKDEIRKKLLIRKVIDRVVDSRVRFTESEARIYYEEHIEDYTVPDQVKARMIVVASLEEAHEVRKRLTRNNFADVAREVSLSPESRKGGDLGFFGHGDMPVEFEKAVFRLDPGEISPVVKTEYGYHVFLLEEEKEGGVQPFEEVKDDIMRRFYQEKAEMAFNSWMTSLKNSAEIEVREELL